MIRKLLFSAIVGATVFYAAAQGSTPPVTYGVRLGMDVTFTAGRYDTSDVESGSALVSVSQMDYYRNAAIDNSWLRIDTGRSINLSIIFAGSYYAGISSGTAFTPLARYGNRDNKMRIHRDTVAISLGYNF